MWVAGLDGFDMPGQYRSGLGGVFPGLQDDGVRTRRHGGIHGGHDRFARHEVTVQMRVGPAQTAVFAVADTTVGKFDQTAGSDMIAQRGPPHGVGLQAHLFIGGGQEFVYFVSLHVCFGDARSGIAFRRRARRCFSWFFGKGWPHERLKSTGCSGVRLILSDVTRRCDEAG